MTDLSQPQSDDALDGFDLQQVHADLLSGAFFVEYLPTISLADGRMVGAEALSRWRRGTEVWQPERFIEVLYRTPMAALLTYRTIDRVNEDLRDWLIATPELRIGINVPPFVFGRAGIAYAFFRNDLIALADRFILEVTERGIPDQLGMDALNSAAYTGCAVALDDVVLNGANLAILTRCRLDYIKLSRGLIAEISEQTPRPDWLPALESLMRAGGLQVIAEGIETPLQARTLREAGIRLGQGFLYSRPVAADTLIDLHRERFAVW
ncbi:EAL domain-containing protein [Rivibacter subsaxonicus]|uniref:EAL domain-containing protein (Putative c-di-GMP-specific phosphodiesterase class I) n=1 Tax=Rivibacter subsaxonicus TaxID=457575 RepID=A0A4V2FSP5_9BURK|nr:EAL domain-containing protein [Rivibacter subsaxonicus]RZT94935.1 EAL domain-containing protein (putative c-di-GMP-specific phosphodiesterase class I) [Rivibacter subsaxonicus]